MNKVESTIKEELGKVLVNLAVRHIESWAKKELNLLKYALDYPLIVPINDKKLQLDEFTITLDYEHSYKVIKDKVTVHNFYSKKSAILYCVFEKIKNYRLSAEILERDKKVSQVYHDLELYGKKLLNFKSLDNFKKELYYFRYLDAKIKLKTYKRDLEKTLTNAKYMKIWDKIL